MTDCKIEQKYTFNNYDDISDRRIRDDLYMVDFRKGFEVIAARDASNRLVRGSCLAEILDSEAHRTLINYLFGYNEKPMLLRTELGEALVFAGVFASTSIFLLSFLNSNKDSELGRVLASGRTPEVIIPRAYAAGKKIYKRDAKLIEDANYVLENTLSATKSILFHEYVANELTVELFKDTVMSAARVAGCAVELSFSAPPVCDNRFDQSALRAFLISVLMLCRDCGRSRTASVEIANCSEGIAVSVDFETIRPLPVRSTPEIDAFRCFAENNRMIFEYCCDDGLARVRFCPSRKDWSFIELKSHAEFDWDR